MNTDPCFRSRQSRRDFLCQIGGGFAGIALAQMLGREGFASESATPKAEFNGGLHHVAKAKRVIQLFMTGGASPMDTYDYKPELVKFHGQKLGPKEKPEGFTAMPGAIMKSPFEFTQHGECGRWVSSVFPKQAELVDEMAFLMAMTTKTNVHGPATYMMNNGFLLPGFPCMGAWVSYGLGKLSDNLPTFVVLPDAKGLPYNQQGTFSAGFLPAIHQGTVINADAKEPVPNLFPPDKYKFATRETETTRKAYGLDNKVTEDFGRRCLLARRLIERGTRFVQVWSGPQGATANWDNHTNIQTELPAIAATVDLPIAALLQDLKKSGLFKDTLLIWTTEFGRTPFAQGSVGRDHNGGSFVTWLAGAGVKAGSAHGQSDDWGYQTAEGKTDCHDLHATILDLLGIDHLKLTIRHSGIDRRLTDVHGHVVREILA
jgi:hypothetical protein